jgi:hypothetical protein
MFGSVFRMLAKPGAKAQIMRLMDEDSRMRSIPGFQSAYVFDAGGDELWGVAVFDNEKSYRDNASDPTQDEWYRRLRALLQADPEWHDGTIQAWHAERSAVRA